MYNYPNFSYPNYQMPQQIPQRHEVIKVNGKGGAEAFQMMPNSNVLLLDETAPIVWFKTTDGAGYPTLTPYQITPYEPEKPVDVKSLEERIERIERLVSNESHFAINEQSEFVTDKTNDANGKKRKKSASDD